MEALVFYAARPTAADAARQLALLCRADECSREELHLRGCGRVKRRETPAWQALSLRELLAFFKTWRRTDEQ